MDYLKIDTDDLRSQILNKSFYFSEITDKDKTQIELIELDKFDYDKIVIHVNNSTSLLSFDKPLILEILDIMNKNKNSIGLEQQNNIGLYCNGKPLLRILIHNVQNTTTTQLLHVSLQKYKIHKIESITEKKLNRINTCCTTGILLLSSIFLTLSLIKRN